MLCIAFALHFVFLILRRWEGGQKELRSIRDEACSNTARVVAQGLKIIDTHIYMYIHMYVLYVCICIYSNSGMQNLYTICHVQ